MGCMGGCGGSSSEGKSSNHSTKKAPNWGSKPSGIKKTYSGNNSSSFGSPKVRMSFGSGKKRGY